MKVESRSKQIVINQKTKSFMSHNIKTISRCRCGELSICPQCNVYHLMFNNLFFELTPQELSKFRNYLFNIELDYWEQKYACARIKKKIPIPSSQHNLVLMFNRHEIEELKSLFVRRKNVENHYLEASEIDYKIILN